VVLLRITLPWATVTLALLAALPPRVRSPAPILVSVLLLTEALTVRLPPMTFRVALLPRLMVPVQVLAPERMRRAPELFMPVPLSVRALLTVSPPATSSDAPDDTVTALVPSELASAKVTTPSETFRAEASDGLAAPSVSVPRPRLRSVAPEVVVTAALRFSVSPASTWITSSWPLGAEKVTGTLTFARAGLAPVIVRPTGLEPLAMVSEPVPLIVTLSPAISTPATVTALLMVSLFVRRTKSLADVTSAKLLR